MSLPIVASCLQSYTIAPGGSISIPGSSVIVGIDATDLSLITTECPALEDQIQNADSYLCYYFHYATDDGANPGTHVFDSDNATLSAIIINGVTYDLPDGLALSSTDSVAFRTAITNAVPSGLLKVISSEKYEDLAQRDTYRVHVKMIASVAAVAEFKILGDGFEAGAYVKPILETCS
jgi:hypothetical protein